VARSIDPIHVVVSIELDGAKQIYYLYASGRSNQRCAMNVVIFRSLALTLQSASFQGGGDWLDIAFATMALLRIALFTIAM
jgi:hypothetical protein